MAVINYALSTVINYALSPAANCVSSIALNCIFSLAANCFFQQVILLVIFIGISADFLRRQFLTVAAVLQGIFFQNLFQNFCRIGNTAVTASKNRSAGKSLNFTADS